MAVCVRLSLHISVSLHGRMHLCLLTKQTRSEGLEIWAAASQTQPDAGGLKEMVLLSSSVIVAFLITLW